jgi:hypothetical protein
MRNATKALQVRKSDFVSRSRRAYWRSVRSVFSMT